MLSDQKVQAKISEIEPSNEEIIRTINTNLSDSLYTE